MQDLKLVRSIETEEAILVCCLVAGCTHGLDPQAFYLDSHQAIARAILAIDTAGQQPDLVTVTEWLASQGTLEVVGGAMALARLAGKSSGDPGNLETYGRIVNDYWLARKAQMESVAFLGGLSDRKGRSYADIVSAYSQKLLSIGDGSKQEDRQIPIKDACSRFVADLESDVPSAGVPTGWIHYDRATGGLQPGQLVLVAGRPSMGKSGLALNWLLNSAQKGHSSLLFSMEMSERSIMERLISRLARVDGMALRDKRLNESDYQRVYEAVVKLANLPMMLIDGPETDLGVVIKGRRHRKRLVFLDYLGLIARTEKASTLAQELGAVTRRLKLLAVEMGCTVILLAQLNRDLEKSVATRA